MINSLKLNNFFHNKNTKISLTTLVLILKMVVLIFSIFDLVDKYDLITGEQLKIKIAFVVLTCVCLVASTIMLMFVVSNKNINFLNSFILVVFVVTLWLGYGGVLVPELPHFFESNFFILKNIIFIVAIISTILVSIYLVVNFKKHLWSRL